MRLPNNGLNSRGELSSLSETIPCILSYLGNEYRIMVSRNVTLGLFTMKALKMIGVNSGLSYFILIGNMMLSSTLTMDQIYEKYSSPDGVLLLSLLSENCFG